MMEEGDLMFASHSDVIRGSRDYAVTLKVRNGRILSLMDEHGLKSQVELAKAAGIAVTAVNQLINMKVPGIGHRGEFREIAQRVAAVFGCDPDELFNERQKERAVEVNSQTVFMSEPELARLTSGNDMEESLFARDTVQKLLENSKLTPKMQGIVEAISEGETLDEVGSKYGIGRQRASQIYAQALRRMKEQAYRQKIISRPVRHYPPAGVTPERLEIERNPTIKALLKHCITAVPAEVLFRHRDAVLSLVGQGLLSSFRDANNGLMFKTTTAGSDLLRAING